jgi:hypothetical protein
MPFPIFPTNIPFIRSVGFKKTPHFNTITHKPAAGRGVVTASLVPYPTWDFDVSVQWIRGDEAGPFTLLAGFLDVFIQCQGSGVFFYFTDPRDNTVSGNQGVMLNVTPGAANPMSTFGDGVSTQFQLARTIGPSGLAIDIIQNVVGTPIIMVNGTPTLEYSISSTGVISFDPSLMVPPYGASLSWTGNFRYLCQFSEDTQKDLARVGAIANVDDPAVYDGLWSCGGIKFSSVFQL